MCMHVAKAATRRILSPAGPLTAPPAACQVRLAELLTDVIATRGGTWEELWRVHDAALAELVLQVQGRYSGDIAEI